VPAGRFKTVHVRDDLPGDSITEADYWISPDVPGQIVKIRYSSPGTTQIYELQLTELSAGNTTRILESELEAAGAQASTGSEGSPEDPVFLHLEEPHYGSVGPQETSYYAVTIKRRGDMYVQVVEHQGDAELFYHGSSGFSDWRSSSQGYTMDIEDYFVEPGTTLYFSVVDYPEGLAPGEQYTITVSQSYILHPTGIMIRGDIYTQAKGLSAGANSREKLNKGLNYYRVRVLKGPNLLIRAQDLSDHAELIWFGTEGGEYSAASTTRQGNTRRLEISGLTAGTDCYFYISGDSERIPANHVFQIQVSEY
jgi:hypothetical protein